MFAAFLFSVVALFTVTNASSLPYVVSIENFRGLHVAGGVLVAEDLVITCAHNIDKVTLLNVRVGSPVVGVGGQLIPVKKNCPVTNYNFQSRQNDIAVLRLTKKVVLNNNVSTLKIYSDGKTVSNLGNLAGWGYNVQGGLESVEVKKVEETSCKKIYGEEAVPESACCADYLDNKHSCLDAVIGNPLVVDNAVVGVVAAAGSCDLKGHPALIAKISPNTISADIEACN